MRRERFSTRHQTSKVQNGDLPRTALLLATPARLRGSKIRKRATTAELGRRPPASCKKPHFRLPAGRPAGSRTTHVVDFSKRDRC